MPGLGPLLVVELFHATRKLKAEQTFSPGGGGGGENITLSSMETVEQRCVDMATQEDQGQWGAGRLQVNPGI